MAYATALVLLPPPRIATLVNTLRSANDKAWPRWPAHITVLFPCGAAEDLPQFANSLRETLSRPEFQPFHIKLDRVGRFATRDYETVHLGSSNSSRSEAIWRAVSEPAENTHNCKRTTYVPHMTLGQTTRRTDSVAFLTGKAARLIEGHDLRWLVDSVVLLQKNTERGGAMEVYAQIPIGARTALVPKALPSLATPSYHFDGSHWTPRTPPASPARASFTAATYNILHDPAFPFPSRLTAVINALLECDADLVCLQEVTDDALALITADAQIRARWPWCSRGASAVLESERNVVLLAKEDSAFEWTRVELGGKHKACIVARLCFQLQHSTTNKSVVVVGVHLSAGRTPPARQKRQEELTKLLAYLREHHHSDEWLVIGDSNSQVDESHIDFNATLLDCWAETVGGDGATYDPTKNLLASATARNNQTAERYDRVFVREEGWLEIKSEGLSLFGIPEQGRDVGSDHWGLRAVVDIRDEGQAKGSTTSALARIPDHPALPPAGTVLTDLELHNLCVENGCIPTEAHNIAYQNALDTLRGFLDDLCSRSQPISQPSADSNPSTSTSAPSAVRLVLAPVGSFAMGYHTPDSDIDCVVVGNVNPNTFWGLIRSRIRAAGGQGPVKLRRFVKDALVQMMELQVDLVKVDLQYCPAANLIEWCDRLSELPRNSLLFSLPASALRTLNARRDMLAVIDTLPSLEAFRLAHRALKLFLANHGIVGARFGYLGGFHLAFLLARVCLLSEASDAASAARLVRAFFRMYARWDWAREIVAVPMPAMANGGDDDDDNATTRGVVATYHRSSREAMVVLSIEKPQVNMTANAHPNSVTVISRVFALAERACVEGLPWRSVCAAGDGQGPPYARFVRAHAAFVKIELCYWGRSCTKGRALVGWLESRFVALLVQLHACAPNVCAHLWPARFADASTADEQTLNAFYLIGLSPLSTKSEQDSKLEDNTPASKQSTTRLRTSTTIDAALWQFESDVRAAQGRYCDPAEAFVAVKSATAADLPAQLGLDAFRWPDGGFDADEEEREEDAPDDDGAGEWAEDGFSSKKKKSKKNKGKSGKTGRSAGVPAPKLRTSADVYARLMWDPAMARGDYVIGYEDRFVGIMETPLSAWKREVEDEAFIPFHRVAYFKRKSDGVVVWDKRTRTDLVFGSGTTA